MKPVKRITLMVLLLTACWSQLGLALSTDKDKPINIEADRLEIDEQKHISIYQGNVEMQQGSLNIRADRIEFHFNPKNELQRLEIMGSPALFNQLNDQQEPMTGSASRMLYFEDKSLLELHGKARFQSDEDIIESDQITINTETNALQAGTQKDRVRMLIQPKK